MRTKSGNSPMSDNLLSGKPGLGSRAHFGLQSVDKLTWAFLKSDQWTYCDQRRLNSIDSLVSRSLEYHNLNHSFRTIDRRLEQRLGPVAADALEFVYLGEDAPAGAPYSCQVSISQMRTFLDGLGRYGRSRGVCWLHVRDLRALGPLARHFKMDYICQAGFHDLRSHSNVHCTHDAMFMTLCTVAMLEDFHFYKSYVYASKGVCITFERELLADLSSGKEPIGDLMWEGLSRRIVGLVRRCGQMGSMHFIYEMAKEMMDLSDGVLEFVSRATSYITVTMNKDVSFQQLLSIYRKIHILRSSLQVLDRQIAESHRFFAQMMDTWSSTHQRAIQSVLQPVNLPYLSDVTDSYRYRSETLKYMNSEQLSEILDTLTALRNIRTIKTNIDLTLIATVFLPLTFIASVFGMNFEQNGGYSIPLLNYQFGPQIFWLMCGGVLVANFVFFLSSGYLSWERTYKLIVEDKSHEKSVAMVEEQRRQTESQMHREAAVFGLFEASRFTTSADRWNQPKNGPGPAQMRPSAQVISPMVVEKISDSRRGDNVTY